VGRVHFVVDETGSNRPALQDKRGVPEKKLEENERLFTGTVRTHAHLRRRRHRSLKLKYSVPSDVRSEEDEEGTESMGLEDITDPQNVNQQQVKPLPYQAPPKRPNNS